MKTSYNEARILIVESKSPIELLKNTKTVQTMVQNGYLDEYQANKLEKLGFSRFYQLEKETRGLIQNQKINF